MPALRRVPSDRRGGRLGPGSLVSSRKTRLEVGGHRAQLAQVVAGVGQGPGDRRGVGHVVHRPGVTERGQPEAGGLEHRVRAHRVGDAQPYVGRRRRGEHVGDATVGDPSATGQDRHVVADLLDLAEQVAGQEDRGAAVGAEPAEQLADVDDALRVEAVARLVEDQQPGLLSSAAAMPRRCFMPRE